MYLFTHRKHLRASTELSIAQKRTITIDNYNKCTHARTSIDQNTSTQTEWSRTALWETVDETKRRQCGPDTVAPEITCDTQKRPKGQFWNKLNVLCPSPCPRQRIPVAFFIPPFQKHSGKSQEVINKYAKEMREKKKYNRHSKMWRVLFVVNYGVGHLSFNVRKRNGSLNSSNRDWEPVEVSALTGIKIGKNIILS